MLNQRIEIRRSGSFVSMLGFAIGGFLLITAVVLRSFHPALGAVLPLALGIAFRRKAHPEVLVLDDDGIDFQTFNFQLPYRDITWLSLGGQFVTDSPSELPSGSIGVGYDGGFMQLPEPIDISTQEFVRFLFERMPARPVKQPPTLLAEHWDKECAKFGADKVTVIHAREVVPEKQPRSKYARAGLASLASGIICFALAATVFETTDENAGYWLGLSIFAILVSIILFFIGSSQNRQRKKQRSTSRGACIIISPSGLAMIQGPLKGVVRWDEIVKLENGTAGSLGDRDSALHLIISGGKITVLDFYETSLVGIASQIRKNLGVKT